MICRIFLFKSRYFLHFCAISFEVRFHTVPLAIVYWSVFPVQLTAS